MHCVIFIIHEVLYISLSLVALNPYEPSKVGWQATFSNPSKEKGSLQCVTLNMISEGLNTERETPYPAHTENNIEPWKLDREVSRVWNIITVTVKIVADTCV
jgi:hypothetical protein